MGLYNEDSFFTLTPSGQVLLACLSLTLTIGVFWLGWGLMKGRGLGFRLAVASVIFYGFLWLSPQVYYTLYYFILSDLPWQLVIQAPPTPKFLAGFMSFSERANLSFHSQALLGWGLFLMAALFDRFKMGRVKNSKST